MKLLNMKTLAYEDCVCHDIKQKKGRFIEFMQYRIETDYYCYVITLTNGDVLSLSNVGIDDMNFYEDYFSINLEAMSDCKYYTQEKEIIPRYLAVPYCQISSFYDAMS